MTQQITITVSDHVYDMYIGTIDGNKSRHIEGWILLANSFEETGIKDLKLDYRKMLALKKRQKEIIKEQERKIANLERDLARYKKLYQDPEQRANRKVLEKEITEELLSKNKQTKIIGYLENLTESKEVELERALHLIKKDKTLLEGRLRAWNNKFDDDLKPKEFEKLINEFEKKQQEVQDESERD